MERRKNWELKILQEEAGFLGLKCQEFQYIYGNAMRLFWMGRVKVIILITQIPDFQVWLSDEFITFSTQP